MFSFIDQIYSLGDGSIEGRFAVPSQFGGAPDWLIVEAVGQLAGWAAMRASKFSVRPVGATVGHLNFGELRLPRGIIDLSATIERSDRRAILYRGAASCEGELVAEMRRCIGPLLPMEMFDDPAAAEARFEKLVGPDPMALWSAQDAVPAAVLGEIEADESGDFGADFRVSADAALFCDHFPRQPVVPATLLIEAMCRVGATAIGRNRDEDQPPTFREVRQVKVRQFTKPGDLLRISVAVADAGSESAEARVSAHNQAELIATVRVFCGPV